MPLTKVAKSKFKPHGGDDDEALQALRGLVLGYEAPTEPVDVEWEADA